MAEAFFWGLLAASSLMVGGVLALEIDIHERVLGLIMAFGAGVLISAVAFELVEQAFETSHGGLEVAVGLLAGAFTFYAGDLLIDRMGGSDRKRMAGAQAPGSALAIVLGIVLDGIPESIVLGLSILTGGSVSVAFLAAVFLSNLPEAIAATAGLAAGGWARARILGLWALVVLVSAVAALLGYGLFDSASPRLLAFVLAFAGGAVLTMLADTMIPEAYEHGGKLVGVVTTIGFGAAFALSALE
jgi:ZIP family zinc transporter